MKLSRQLGKHRLGLVGLLLLWTLSQGAALAAIEPSDHCPRNRQGNHLTEAKCFALSTAGGERTFQLYTPKNQRSNLALVLVLHGGGGTGRNMEWLTGGGFDRIADRDGVLIAYPDGIDKGWNDGRSDIKSGQSGIDDVAFLVGLVKELAANYPIDQRRVYATGISNGGMMSYRLACDAANVFAAVAPVVADLSVELEARCHPSRPISIAILDGVDDPIMPWNGGDVAVLGRRRGAVISATQSFEQWRNLDGCTDPQMRALPDADPRDGTTIRLHLANACQRNVEVRLYEIDGGGHTWPQGKPYLGPRLVGKVSQDLNANAEIWAFLQRFSLPDGPR